MFFGGGGGGENDEVNFGTCAHGAGHGLLYHYGSVEEALPACTRDPTLREWGEGWSEGCGSGVYHSAFNSLSAAQLQAAALRGVDEVTRELCAVSTWRECSARDFLGAAEAEGRLALVRAGWCDGFASRTVSPPPAPPRPPPPSPPSPPPPPCPAPPPSPSPPPPSPSPPPPPPDPPPVPPPLNLFLAPASPSRPVSICRWAGHTPPRSRCSRGSRSRSSRSSSSRRRCQTTSSSGDQRRTPATLSSNTPMSAAAALVDPTRDAQPAAAHATTGVLGTLAASAPMIFFVGVVFAAAACLAALPLAPSMPHRLRHCDCPRFRALTLREEIAAERKADGRRVGGRPSCSLGALLPGSLAADRSRATTGAPAQCTRERRRIAIADLLPICAVSWWFHLPSRRMRRLPQLAHKFCGVSSISRGRDVRQ